MSNAKKDIYDILVEVATDVRNSLVLKNKNVNENLYGCCICASNSIHDKLKALGIDSTVVEGWCVYEDDSSCSDRCYDEHTWLECNGYYVDVTASQFNSCMFNDLADIIVQKEKPTCMQCEEPTFKWLDEADL